MIQAAVAALDHLLRFAHAVGRVAGGVLGSELDRPSPECRPWRSAVWPRTQRRARLVCCPTVPDGTSQRHRHADLDQTALRGGGSGRWMVARRGGSSREANLSIARRDGWISPDVCIPPPWQCGCGLPVVSFDPSTAATPSLAALRPDLGCAAGASTTLVRSPLAPRSRAPRNLSSRQSRDAGCPDLVDTIFADRPRPWPAYRTWPSRSAT